MTRKKKHLKSIISVFFRVLPWPMERFSWWHLISYVPFCCNLTIHWLFLIEALSDARKRYFSGVVGESAVLKLAVFIAVVAVRSGLRPETILTGM